MFAHQLISRRGFVAAGAATVSALMTGRIACGEPARAADAEHRSPAAKGKADRCIFIWLGGGACHIDTFDPKRKGDGKKVAGSYYDAIETAIPGEKVCQ